MSAALQAKIENLSRRLKAENEAKEENLLDLAEEEISAPRGPAKGLNFGSPSRRQRPGLHLGVTFGQTPSRQKPQKQSSLEDESGHIDMKLQDIKQQTGILTLEGKKMSFTVDDLHPLEDIGSGTCGQVYKMKHVQSGKVMAVKKMRRTYNKEEQKRILMDLEVVMKSHDCPYIVECYGSYISKSDVYICMEPMLTCLDKLVKCLPNPIPERIIGKMAVAIVKALHYLKEKQGIMHRDVKPSNMLLDENGCVKLCDFGISGRLVDSKAKTRSAGCAAYMAPERIDPPDPTNPDYDVRADVWSLGISLVEMASGEFPYKNCTTEFEVLAKVMNEDAPHLPRDKGFSMDFCSFVAQCLLKDFKDRPKYPQLLIHPFIQRYEELDVDVTGWLQEIGTKLKPR